jgi:hypothetical protein
MRKEVKHLDLELLIFFISVSTFSFILYVIRHPLIFSWIKVRKIDLLPFFSAYSFDLIIFLSVLVPYIFVIVLLLYFKVIKKIKKIPDNVMVILFFPLLSFFTKGMSLLHVYIEYSIIEIFKVNFAFFAFLFIGPLIVITHKIIVKIRKRKKSKKKNKNNYKKYVKK